jgi:hypothetical protein
MKARLLALTAFLRDRAEIVGVEPQRLEMPQTWIDATFTGLLTHGVISWDERAERRRSVDMLSSFLMATTFRLEPRKAERTHVLNFFVEANIMLSLQHDTGRWCTEYTYSGGDSMVVYVRQATRGGVRFRGIQRCFAAASFASGGL